MKYTDKPDQNVGFVSEEELAEQLLKEKYPMMWFKLFWDNEPIMRFKAKINPENWKATYYHYHEKE